MAPLCLFYHFLERIPWASLDEGPTSSFSCSVGALYFEECLAPFCFLIDRGSNQGTCLDFFSDRGSNWVTCLEFLSTIYLLIIFS